MNGVLNKTMKPSKNGTHAPKGDASRTARGAAFSNYAGDVPLGINEIFDSLMALTNGWPNVISGTLCCLKGQKVRPLKNLAALFAWIRKQHPVDWKSGSGRIVPMEQFFEHLLAQEEEYSWASADPHFPAVPGVYYLTKPPKAKNTGKLDELLDRFCPKTAIDRELIRAFALTLFWGGPAGQRPQIVVVADPSQDEHGGRGTGKTKLVELLAGLVGGPIDIQPGIRDERVVSNLLSPTSWERRVVLVDNLKTLHYSNGPVESYITRSEITGHRLHQGFAMRPITSPGPSRSTELLQYGHGPPLGDDLPQASRAVLRRLVHGHGEIHRRTPGGNRRRRALAPGSQRSRDMKPAQEDTWADWRKGVLSRCENPDKVVARMEKRRKRIDGDKEDLANTVTHIRACFRKR